MALLYRPLVLQTQDPDFFASIYRQGWWVNQAFMTLFTLVLDRCPGDFWHFAGRFGGHIPALIARCWSNHMGRIMLLSFLALLGAGWGGLVVSLSANGLPLSPIIVMVLFGLWLLSYLLGPYGLQLSLTSSQNKD